MDFQSTSSTNNSSSADESKIDIVESGGNVELQAMGYTPELRRHFSIWSILGVGFGLTNSWCGLSASLVTGISTGGCMVIVYGVIIVAVLSTAVAVTLSELASAIPNAGGQYVWTKILAPRKHAPFWSFLCGSLAYFGALFTNVSVSISLANMITAFWALQHPGYVQKSWHVFVIFQMIHWITFIFNCYDRWLPAIANLSLYSSILSWLVISITVLACSKGEFQPAEFVFVEFDNKTGWSSAAIAFITGLINPAWSFSCLDCATHMAEEVLKPERVIPISIMSTIAIGFVTAFSYALVIFFCIKDISSILTSSTSFPVLDIYYQVLQNKGGALFLGFLVFFSLFGCNIQCQTWQQRLCWSFSRDNGIIGSRYWRQVNKKVNVPLNAHIFSGIADAALGCIYLGSTTAYNSLVTGCITFLLLSYAIPVVFLLMKKRNIKKGPFWLGPIGFICNIITLAWTLFALVFFSFPSVMPAERESMNYASCATVGVVLYSVIYWWIRGRKQFIMRDQE